MTACVCVCLSVNVCVLHVYTYNVNVLVCSERSRARKSIYTKNVVQFSSVSFSLHCISSKSSKQNKNKKKEKQEKNQQPTDDCKRFTHSDIQRKLEQSKQNHTQTENIATGLIHQMFVVCRVYKVHMQISIGIKITKGIL